MANSRKSNSDNLLARVAANVSLLPADSSILVGLSGGVDSVVLLHLLHRLAPSCRWRVRALHVHHGISPNADAWADFCTRLCASLSVPLHVVHVDIAPLRAQGLEAAARTLRHAAFASEACDFVALAHHADDQAETLFLQLLRGAGVKGAAAMPVLSESKRPVLSESKRPVLSESKWPVLSESKRSSHQLLRPLLHCSREDIVGYAAAHALQWIEDESNADDSYPRNFLRHRLLPLLGEKFPAYRDTLARSVQHFAEASRLLDELAQQDAAQAVHAHALSVEVLQALSVPRAKNLLRYFLHQLGAPMPQAVQLDEMLQQLCGARHDAMVCLEYGEWQVRRYRECVYVLPVLGEFDRSLALPWQGEVQLVWSALGAAVVFQRGIGQGVSLKKLQGSALTLRLRQGGERLRPQAKAATRSLKNLLQEQHIPPWRRDRLPLLYCGDELVCVPGVAIAAEYQAASGEASVSLSIQ